MQIYQPGSKTRGKSRDYWRGSGRFAGKRDAQYLGYDVTIYENSRSPADGCVTASRHFVCRSAYSIMKLPAL